MRGGNEYNTPDPSSRDVALGRHVHSTFSHHESPTDPPQISSQARGNAMDPKNGGNDDDVDDDGGDASPLFDDDGGISNSKPDDHTTTEETSQFASLGADNGGHDGTTCTGADNGLLDGVSRGDKEDGLPYNGSDKHGAMEEWAGRDSTGAATLRCDDDGVASRAKLVSPMD